MREGGALAEGRTAGWLAARPAPKVMQTANAAPSSSSRSDNAGDAPGSPTRSGPLTSMHAPTKTPLTNDRNLWTPDATRRKRHVKGREDRHTKRCAPRWVQLSVMPPMLREACPLAWYVRVCEVRGDMRRRG
jgi:hypothetical protein